MKNLRSKTYGLNISSPEIYKKHWKKDIEILPKKYRDEALHWIGVDITEYINQVKNKKISNAVIKKQSTNIKNSADKLLKSLNEAHENTIELICNVHGNTDSETGSQSRRKSDKLESDLYNLKFQLKAISEATEKIIKDLPSQNKSVELSDLLEKLAVRFFHYTGKRPTANFNNAEDDRPTDFDKFCNLIFRSLPDGDGYRHGFDPARRSAIKNWKKRSR